MMDFEYPLEDHDVMMADNNNQHHHDDNNDDGNHNNGDMMHDNDDDQQQMEDDQQLHPSEHDLELPVTQEDAWAVIRYDAKKHE